MKAVDLSAAREILALVREESVKLEELLTRLDRYRLMTLDEVDIIRAEIATTSLRAALADLDTLREELAGVDAMRLELAGLRAEVKALSPGGSCGTS